MDATTNVSQERWQSSASQTGHYMLLGGQLADSDKLGGQTLDDNVESGLEK